MLGELKVHRLPMQWMTPEGLAVGDFPCLNISKVQKSEYVGLYTLITLGQTFTVKASTGAQLPSLVDTTSEFV